MRARDLGKLVLAGVALACGACGDWPRDPRGTLARVEHGVLRVGTPDPQLLSENERNIVERVAADLDARIEWERGALGDLVRGFDGQDVDLVVGGIAPTDPWGSRAALSRAFDDGVPTGRPARRVLALPAGENAFLLRVDRVIARREGRDAP